MAGPPISSSDDRARTWLLFAAGLVATIALVFGVVQLWPDGDGDDGSVATDDPTTPTSDFDLTPTVPASGATGEPSDRPGSGTVATLATPATDLFRGGATAAMAELVKAAGDPTQAIEMTIYETYAFLAYRDPSSLGNIDRRMWRDGEVDAASPNPIDDRVEADTEPELFAITDVDLSVIPALAADAVTRYDRPVAVSHIIIDRFLPFDERVLIRVYASPTDGRSGGGYVSYDTAGTFVSVCC